MTIPASNPLQAATFDTATIQGTVLSTLSESTERENRKKNAIIFNMPEEDGDQTDSRKFIEMCQTSLAITLVVEKTYRLGKKGAENSMRPLVVRLPEERMHRLLLLKAKQLRQSQNQNETKVFIRPDLTKMQQIESKSLHAELKNKIQENPNILYTILNGRVESSGRTKNRSSNRQASSASSTPP